MKSKTMMTRRQGLKLPHPCILTESARSAVAEGGEERP